MSMYGEMQAAGEYKRYESSKTHVRMQVMACPEWGWADRLIEIGLRHLPEGTATSSQQCKECGHDWPCWTYVAATGEGRE